MSNSTHVYRNFKTDNEHIVKLESVETDPDLRNEAAQMILEDEIDEDSKNDWLLDNILEGNIY